MMQLRYIIILVLVFSCSNENANDCFQTSGKIVTQEVEVTSFTKILVNRGVELIVSESVDYEVVIKTGENLLNDVEAKVIGDELQISDNNNCNFVRDYGITKVFVTAPNITEIRSSTQYDISSQGILNYSSLRLLSEDFNEPETFTVGDFRLELNSTHLSITENNISTFYISGQTENLYIGFFAGAGRFEGENLIAQHVDIFHRGSNDIIINPQQSLLGELRGTGNVIAVNQPLSNSLEQFYIGQLIFID